MTPNLSCDHIQMGFLGRFSESSVILCTIHASEGISELGKAEVDHSTICPTEGPYFWCPPQYMQFTISYVDFHTESPLL